MKRTSFLRPLLAPAPLPPDEEAALVACIIAANEEVGRLRVMVEQVGASEWLTAAIADADRRATALKWTLVQSCMRYVFYMASKYRRGQTTTDELLSEGYLFLLTLAGNYRPRRKGPRFSAYAGQYLKYHFWYVQGFRRKGVRRRQVHSREILPSEFATSGTVVDELIDREAAPQAKALDRLRALRPQEQEVLTRRLGLDGSQGESIRQVGRDLRLAATTVQYMELSGLKKLRKELV